MRNSRTSAAVQPILASAAASWPEARVQRPSGVDQDEPAAFGERVDADAAERVAGQRRRGTVNIRSYLVGARVLPFGERHGAFAVLMSLTGRRPPPAVS